MNTVIASDIEAALKAKFIEDPNIPDEKKFKAIDVQKEIVALSRPGLSWAVIEGKDSKITSTCIEETMKIIGTIAVKNVASEEERRKTMAPLVRYLQVALLDEDLDLDIDPIQPTRWDEVTTPANLEGKLMVVEVQFETAVEFTKEEVSFHTLDSIFHSIVFPDTGETALESDTVFNSSEEV